MADLKVYEWNGHTWAGWWDGDVEKPVVHVGVELRQFNHDLHQGMAMCFELLNGDDYSDGSEGLNRYIMEATKVDFYSGDFTLEGFVIVESFGPSHERRNPDRAAYRKQRWVVTKVLPR